MKKGEVYYADLSPAVGSEQGGIRPVLIIQNNRGNNYAPTTIIAPLTSRKKNDLPTHVYTTELGIGSIILCEQIRTIDKRRLKEKCGTLSEDTIKKVERAILKSFGIVG